MAAGSNEDRAFAGETQLQFREVAEVHVVFTLMTANPTDYTAFSTSFKLDVPKRMTS